MKKTRLRRLCALLLMVLLLIGNLSVGSSAVFVNGQWVIYTITNDLLQPLSYNTMPFMHSSVLYVPYTVFSEHMGLGGLYNGNDQILILATSEKTLFFDLKNGTAYDDAGYGFSRTALQQNGTIYVPARFTAEYFGLQYTYDSNHSVVRITDSTARYSMDSILLFYSKSFDALLELYQNAPPPAPDPETATPVPLYLMFAGGLGAETEQLLGLLSRSGLKATFFLTADTILEHEDLVRRIYVEGHTIGVASASGLPESPDALIRDFDAANAALFRVLRTMSRMVYLPGGSAHEHYTDDYFARLVKSGYQYWDLTIIPNDTAADADPEALADDVIMTLITTESEQTLALHSTTAAHETLLLVLEYMERREGEILTADLLTEPVRWAA